MSSHDASIPHPREQASEASPSPTSPQVVSAESGPSTSTDSSGTRLTDTEMADIFESAAESLREYGRKIRKQIEGNPRTVAVLERSASDRAHCRANEDCFNKVGGDPDGIRITSPYRIRIEGPLRLPYHICKPVNCYYHVGCFTRMMEPHTMIDGENFQLRGGPYEWGLIMRKWYDNRGRVDLDKLGEYVEAHQAYERAKNLFDSEWIKWQLSHNGPRPDCPEEPVLKGYRTPEDHVCDLLAVLSHKNIDAMPPVWWIIDGPYGQRASNIMPEKEETVYMTTNPYWSQLQ